MIDGGPMPPLRRRSSSMPPASPPAPTKCPPPTSWDWQPAPTTRRAGHAGLRRGADLLRPRVADGQAGCRLGHRPGGAAADQRAGLRRPPHHRAGHHRHLPSGRGDPPVRRGPGAGNPPSDDRRDLPGGSGRTTDAADTVRGTGFAVGFKNLMFSEGYDDYSSAACRVADGVATVTCACAEVGQGFVTLAQQNRPHRAGGGRGDPGPGPNRHRRLGGVELGQPPNLDVGRRSAGRLPGRARSDLGRRGRGVGGGPRRPSAARRHGDDARRPARSTPGPR